MELALSLEKLNFDKLLALWEVGGGRSPAGGAQNRAWHCPWTRFRSAEVVVWWSVVVCQTRPEQMPSQAVLAGRICSGPLRCVRCRRLYPCCAVLPLVNGAPALSAWQVVDQHGDPQLTQYVEDMLQEQVCGSPAHASVFPMST